ncbi:CDP-glucose 4,6-dehydratase [Diaphorobacter sp.]|uniref:CDP-glucose 4,6-dehydratase n=1 Tax=Diaphorobacter sp. TaxID=1934310 RepID=UPI003D0FCB5F
MELSPAFWTGRRVLLTGHTGFKGGWLSLWLHMLGAKVQGYALPPATTPSLWLAARLDELTPGALADIRDITRVDAAVTAFQPEVILHLAAQPLVRASYAAPTETYATNVMGTVYLLEAARRCASVRAVVVVTSDKCYDNREWPWPYRENDALGGYDPYSSSKACVELLCASWRASFLQDSGVALATARAGNVLGGGDWSPDRLVPDALRAWERGETLTLRHPHATRPWQHVLEPLHGYLLLAQSLAEGQEHTASAWNFGPDSEGLASVADVIAQLSALWPGPAAWRIEEQTREPHEAGRLALDSSKANQHLNWRPRWTLAQTLARTTDWHSAWRTGKDMQDFTRMQIAAFQDSAQ